MNSTLVPLSYTENFSIFELSVLVLVLSISTLFQIAQLNDSLKQLSSLKNIPLNQKSIGPTASFYENTLSLEFETSTQKTRSGDRVTFVAMVAIMNIWLAF